MTYAVVGTAGHIDHGKSSLVKALTGTDPDRLKEEQARGITIDLGFAHWTVNETRLAFVDVPGHERFVRNMLAGAGGIDVVLLVVAADESVMPQTREHFDIVRLLGVGRGLVAITKADLVDADTLSLVGLEVADLVRGSPLDGAPIVPVSARSGQGLEVLGRHLRALASGVATRDSDGLPRLPIDRVFSIRGFGTVVTGTLVSGRIGEGDELEVLPGGRRVKVRGVQVHGQAAAAANAGQRAALNLSGADVGELARGDVIAGPGGLQPSRFVDAVVEVLPAAPPLRHGARVRVHQGTAEVIGRVTLPAGRSGETAVDPGATGLVRLRLERPIVLTRGDRFIIRAYSPPLTIGGGIVLDPLAPSAGVRRAGTLDRMRRLLPAADGSPDAAVVALVEEAGPRGLARSAVVTRCGVAPARLAALVDRLQAQGAVDPIGGRLFPPGCRGTLTAKLIDALDEHHSRHPLSDGLPREEARERVSTGAALELADTVLAEALASGRITGRDRLALAGRGSTMSPGEIRAREWIERTLREGGLAPPDLVTAAAASGFDARLVERVVGVLARQRVVVRLEGVAFHPDALARLKVEVRQLKTEDGASLDVATFKQRFGLSRKYAIPLLEYLDRERVTKRVGDRRVVV